MSQFECPVVRVSIEPHPNADAIELARVGGYLSVVKKGQFKDGNLAIYIPESSVVPEWLLKLLGFWDEVSSKGKLSGGPGNRVRAMKLRGILSQGLLLNFADHDGVPHLPVQGEHPELGVDFDRTSFPDLAEGQNFAEYLGVTKYEPVVPQNMAGRVAGGDLDATIGYDFENLKKHPTLFEDGQVVVITEKLHGTCLQVGLVPQSIWEGKKWADKCPDFPGGYKGIVTSKGQGQKGLMLDPSDETNLYVSTVKKLGLWEKLNLLAYSIPMTDPEPIFLFGEIFGAGVQDLTYGCSEPTFRAFDMHIGTRSWGRYVDYDLFLAACLGQDIPHVPVLYRGPFSQEVVELHTNGKTIVGSAKDQIREGVVVRDVRSSLYHHPRYGRYIAKSVSAAYLTRKGEVTEFQ